MKNKFGDTVLFEIPIYSMTEQKFLEKWEQKLKVFLPPREDSSFDEINNLMRQHYRKDMLWQYNQIIGYITVNIHRDDIIFRVYRPLNQRIRYDNTKKRIMENWMCLGTHFYAKNHSGEQLIAEIKSWVSHMVEEYAKKPLYADTALFDATIDCIDIEKLIKLRKVQDVG